MEIKVHTFVSLDGVMQGPGGVQEDPSNNFQRGGWLVPHSADGQLDPVDGWFRQADAILVGPQELRMSRLSRSSRRRVPMILSQCAFAFGACGGLLMTCRPASAKTASKASVNWPVARQNLRPWSELGFSGRAMQLGGTR
ncbi:hypothetical protein [Nonomuraea recticatena]|uniref:Dihydrofolate reductase n=1 Tax=Nonomuraea recticatena TaxID=46178 RepID=A0ABP6FUA5_9ACTN